MTTVVVRSKILKLHRTHLHGLLAWAVYKETTFLGWVLNRMEHPRQWGAVPPPEDDESAYDSIVYDCQTREQALLGLVEK